MDLGKASPEREDLDEGIKLVPSFKTLTKRVNFHDNEIVEIDLTEAEPKEDQFIDLSIDKM